MNVVLADKLTRRLANWPHLLLGLQLLALHALAFGGWRVPAIRLLWVVVIGLFLIWQPFVAGERRIEVRHGVLLLGAVFLTTLVLGPWLLLVWCGALAAAIGTRVVGVGRLAERSGYLLAFGYVVAIAVLGVVPDIAPVVQLDPALIGTLKRFMPFVLPLLLLFPVASAERRKGETFDLFNGVFVFLVLAVFVLGPLAYMRVCDSSYAESVFKTSLTLAGALLVVAWAWNPRAGFAGVGAAVSRYLLSVGMPLEDWLVRLSEESERHASPEAFLRAAMEHLTTVPWIAGVSWGLEGMRSIVGKETAFCHECQVQDAAMLVHFRHPPSPAMRWHVEWLLRLAYEFYLVKRQGEQLQRMGYVQAIYETGARVTHDVKNLLQSLQVLCYAAAQPGNPADVAALLARQLPQIADRLQATLAKLQTPQAEPLERIGAVDWWHRLKARYGHLSIEWSDDPAGEAELPGALFDRVAENLLQNAHAKRLREPGVKIRVAWRDGGMTVSDNGSRIMPGIAARLLSEPVESEDGLGIGLYHAAKQASDLGYRLVISDNRDGCVAFSLQPVD